MRSVPSKYPGSWYNFHRLSRPNLNNRYARRIHCAPPRLTRPSKARAAQQHQLEGSTRHRAARLGSRGASVGGGHGARLVLLPLQLLQALMDFVLALLQIIQPLKHGAWGREAPLVIGVWRSRCKRRSSASARKQDLKNAERTTLRSRRCWSWNPAALDLDSFSRCGC